MSPLMICRGRAACFALPSLSLVLAGVIAAQPSQPQTLHDFECYIQSAEARMEARKTFILADGDAAVNAQLVREHHIYTVSANGANPHKLTGGQLYDWIGAVFIPGTNLEKLLRMLQDYGHRPKYFPETVATSQLLCHTGGEHFRYSMRLKEPAVTDVESDVVWERVDAHRWRCHSYSTKTAEVGKDHGYLRELYSYWWMAETDKGVYVEAETITASDEFSAVSRFLGSALMGINPEKSLKHTLAAMREAVTKPGAEFPPVPEGVAACGAPVARPSGCAASAAR